MTFAHIMDLHVRLLRNDGVEEPGPLYVTLGTKPDFAKRLANLTAGAAEGKGLAELVAWDEESDGFDDQESVRPVNEENDHEDEGTDSKEAAESTETFENEVAEEATAEEEKPASITPAVSLGDDTALGSAREGVNVHEDSSAQATSHDPIQHGEQHGAANYKSSTSGASDTRAHKDDEVDEDGDLIDYSDDEFEHSEERRLSPDKVPQDAHSSTQDGTSPHFFPPCLKPDMCFCPLCTEQLLTKYEAINESLRQRSLSLAAEQEDPQATSQAQHNSSNDEAYEDINRPTQAVNTAGESSNHDNETAENEDYIAYQHEEDKEDDNAIARDTTDAEFALDNTGVQIPFDEITYDGSNDAEPVVEGHTATATEKIIQGQDNPLPEEIDAEEGNEEEIEYEIQGQGPDVPAHNSYEGASELGDEEFKVTTNEENSLDADEISYEEEEPFDSNESERTLIAEESTHEPTTNGGEEADEYEISYEDEDQEELGSFSEVKNVETSPASNGYSVKRSRADADDAIDEGSPSTYNGSLGRICANEQ